MEPIKGNKARYSHITPNNKNGEYNESMMEPITGNKALHSQAKIDQEIEESKEMPQSPLSHKESAEGLTPGEMHFENVSPQINTKEDQEVQQTEMNGEEEEEKVETLEGMKGQPIAKKIKKILYSDKSESSIDEMMEDTPSNYNIPNGRIEGRSLGLKAIIMHEKRQQRGQDPLGDINVTQAGKTLQPESLGKTLATVKKNNLSPIKKAGESLMSPKDNKLGNSGGKVNNLFRDPSNGALNRQEITVNHVTLRTNKQLNQKPNGLSKIDIGGMELDMEEENP